MIIDQTLRRLVLKVAALLTGLPAKRIRIIWRRPACVGAVGVMSKGYDAMIIEINPDRPGDQLLKTFLHECAHILLHSKTVKTSSLSVLPSGSYTSRSDPERLAHKIVETEANELCSFWLDQAKRHAYDHSLYGLLQALKSIYSPGGQGFYY